VNNENNLEKIFEKSPTLIAVHCESEEIIKRNLEYFKTKFGDNIPFEYHNKIRSSEACAESTKHAIALAQKYNSRLHILHISTAEEIKLLGECSQNKNITAETCPHYLWFCDDDYHNLRGRIKCNPAIKTKADRQVLQQAISQGIIKIIGTDHAPHLLSEKSDNYLKCPSGLPSVQQSLNVMLQFVAQNIITLQTLVELMCHNPAKIFAVEKRGFIRENYKADIVLINPNKKFTCNKSNILYKCGWSPYENITFNSKITHTFVNGNLVYNNGKINENTKGERLTFSR
jgi:dihydroorotase